MLLQVKFLSFKKIQITQIEIYEDYDEESDDTESSFEDSDEEETPQKTYKKPLSPPK